MLMKLRNLLVLGALLLAGSASAAIQERQKPAISPIDVKTDGSTMYMYNVEAQKFFLGANDWSTRASVGDKGYKVFFDQEIAEGEAWNGATIQWRDSVENQSAIKHVFMAADGAMWVDNSGENNRLYDIEPVAGKEKTYRIKVGTALNGLNGTYNAEVNPNSYIGVANLETDTRLYWNLSVGQEGAMLDWQFVTPEGYAVYMDAVGVYNVAQNLKAQIEAAVAEGLDVAAWEAVYNNTAATTEELEAAIAAAKEALAKVEELKVDPLNPVSKTSMITNPSYDANDNTGWSGTKPGFQSYDNAEHYNKTFDSWQLVTGLPNGLYKMTVQGFYRPSTADAKGAVFYAANGTDSLTVDVPNINSATALDSKPNNMQSSGNAFHEGHYTTELYFNVVNNQARIGIALPKTTGSTDWVIWDNWQLTYYGNKGEATYTGAVTGLVNAALTKFDGREAEMTAGTIDTYKATLNGLAATDLAGVNAAIATIAEAAAVVQTNIDGWVKYEAEIKRGNDTRNRTDLSPSTQMSQLAAYVARQAPAILKAKALSTEELLAEVAKLTQLIEDAIRNSLQVNSNVTDMFLVNANFDNKADGKNDGQGWEGKWTDINGPSNNPVMEIYGGWDKVDPDWDVYQIVKDAPQGVYEVSLNGFFRAGEHADAYAAYENSLLTGQEITSHASVYVNNNKSAFKNVYSEPVQCGELYSATEIYGPTPWLPVAGDSTGYWYPNGMYDAGVAFAAGMYKSSAHGIVARQGDELRIGVVAKGMIMREWVIFDNFQMIYRGKQAEYVQPHLQEAIDAAAVTLTQPMAKDAKALLEEAKAAAEAVINSTDGDELFNALVAIYAANDSVEASADLFAELKNAAEQLQNAMMIYESTATDEAMAAATDLFTQMMVGVEASALTKDEAQALLGQVDKVINELILGNYKNASDDNVMDFTALLASPSFEDETGAGSAAGWTGADGALGSGGYEFFQKTFDLYQELKNIPNGTYRIEVSAYERIGSSVDDYKTYKAAKDTATTYLYAGSAGDTIETKVARLASGAFLSNDAMGIEGCAKVDSLQNVELGADSLYWVANTMASAMTMFNDYTQYANTYYITVNDGTLRLGIKKEVQGESDWVMMDNWKLYYHGANSIYTVEEVIGTGAAVVKREIFTLGGAQVGKLQQGVNIIRNTHADGTVTVKKVIK